MYSVVENPRGVEAEYQKGLEVCFPGRWNAALYHWYLKRPFGSRYPDITAVVDDGKLVAGMGINYRRLLSPDQRVIDIAVFTAAWALPEHRGRWHFARLIGTARRIARERGCVAALSFVTDDNASAVVLRRAGAESVPTHYLFAPPIATSVPKRHRRPKRLEALARRPDRTELVSSGHHDAIEFEYRTHAEWRDQIMGRPSPTSTWAVGENRVVLEHTATTDRVQFICGPDDHAATLAVLARMARHRNRRFFHFTTMPEVGQRSREHGMEARSGHIMVLDLDSSSSGECASIRALLTAPWRVQAGDRM